MEVNCARMQSLLSSFIDDELGTRDTEALLAHVRACPSCREQLDEMRTLQQLHKRALAHKTPPVCSLAFTKRVMAAVQRQDVKKPLDVADGLPSWRRREIWDMFSWRRRWIVPAIAAVAVAAILVLNPLPSPERGLRPVSELQTAPAEVAAEPDDRIEHYLTEHTISVVEAPVASSTESVEFVSYSR